MPVLALLSDFDPAVCTMQGTSGTYLTSTVSPCASRNINSGQDSVTVLYERCQRSTFPAPMAMQRYLMHEWSLALQKSAAVQMCHFMVVARLVRGLMHSQSLHCSRVASTMTRLQVGTMRCIGQAP